MTEFETRLSECLEALSQGRWDLDECLRRNPEHAAELRPMLLAAAVTARAYDVQPRAEFAAKARERFLIATGQRLQEAMDIEPSPTFFASARVRFLMAAQKMKLGERAAQREPRRVPLFGSPFRALAGGMAAIVVLLGASTYTVSSASAALPGDWQYPIKLQTERVRVALAFTDDAKRSVKLDIAETRVGEIEELTKQHRIIGPGTLDRLVEQTQPLIDDARDGGWAPDEAARLEQVTEKQQQVLATTQIAPDAQDSLSAAVDVSKVGQAVAKRIVVLGDPARGPLVLTPSVPLTATPTPEPTQTHTPAAAPSAVTTPDAVLTPLSEQPEVTPAIASKDIIISAEPVETRNGVKLFSVTAGAVTFLAPSSSDGWKLDDAPESGVPTIIKFSNRDSTSLISINTQNGDMYWYIEQNGRFDEVQMRITKGGATSVADRDVLRGAYGNASDIPWYMLQSIGVIPPTPTPTSTATSTATPPAAAPTPAP